MLNQLAKRELVIAVKAIVFDLLPGLVGFEFLQPFGGNFAAGQEFILSNRNRLEVGIVLKLIAK